MSVQPTAEHAALDVFVGAWRTEGRQLASAVGPAQPVVADETYAWQPGGFFVLHQFNGRVGGDDASCVEVIGYDPDTDRFEVHTFYSNGVVNQWRYQRSARVWTLTGTFAVGGKPTPVRCVLELSEDSSRRHGLWSYQGDAGAWIPFWDVTSVRS